MSMRVLRHFLSFPHDYIIILVVISIRQHGQSNLHNGLRYTLLLRPIIYVYGNMVVVHVLLYRDQSMRLSCLFVAAARTTTRTP